jgi:hypothetical protein
VLCLTSIDTALAAAAALYPAVAERVDELAALPTWIAGGVELVTT